MRFPVLAGLVLLAVSGSAGAQASCEPYPPYPSLCLRAIADGWYQVPGVGPRHADGVVTKEGYDAALFSAAPPPHLETGTGGVGMAGGSHAIFLGGYGTYADYAARLEAVTGIRSQALRDSVISPESSFLALGGLEQRIPVEAWRGRRVAMTLRLRNYGGARAYVSAWVGRGETARRTASQLNRLGSAAWQSHTLVLDVPQDATEFLVFAGFTGEGKIWLDNFTVAAANKEAPPTWSERVDNTRSSNSGWVVPVLTPPSPGPVRHDED